jgi:transposase-like protein
MNFNSLPQILNHFKSQETCISFLEEQRWNGKPVCPHCGSRKTYKTTRGHKCANSECYKKFTVTVGTVFESSKIKLNIWFAAIYLATAHKKGISSLQLHRDLGVTQKTAWFMLHRIREMLREKGSLILTGETQVDETFVGGKNKNRHADKKIENSQGRSVKDKTPVFGLLNNGTVKTQVVPDTKAKTLRPIIEKMVEKGSIVVSDEWLGYTGLSKEYQHEVVKHNEGRFVNNGFHTNSMEGFWSLFKRGIFGIYHYASPKHLGRYTDEFTYRYNTRKLEDKDRFVSSLKSVDGRLTYKQLIQK